MKLELSEGTRGRFQGAKARTGGEGGVRTDHSFQGGRKRLGRKGETAIRKG